MTYMCVALGDREVGDGGCIRDRIPVKVTSPGLTGCYSLLEQRQSTCQPLCATASYSS